MNILQVKNQNGDSALDILCEYFAGNISAKIPPTAVDRGPQSTPLQTVYEHK